MTNLEWVVCERSNHWAAALRTALSRQARTPAATFSLDEVRSLGELTARISERPYSLALVEVAPANFDEVLSWLADAMRWSRHNRAVALLDSTFAYGAEPNRDANCSRQDVADALHEAGAVEIARSPRHLQQVLLLGLRYASTNTVDIVHRAGVAGDAFIEEWAWSLLPWQDAQRPLG